MTFMCKTQSYAEKLSHKHLPSKSETFELHFCKKWNNVETLAFE